MPARTQSYASAPSTKLNVKLPPLPSLVMMRWWDLYKNNRTNRTSRLCTHSLTDIFGSMRLRISTRNIVLSTWIGLLQLVRFFLLRKECNYLPIAMGRKKTLTLILAQWNGQQSTRHAGADWVVVGYCGILRFQDVATFITAHKGWMQQWQKGLVYLFKVQR